MIFKLYGKMVNDDDDDDDNDDDDGNDDDDVKKTIKNQLKCLLYFPSF